MTQFMSGTKWKVTNKNIRNGESLNKGKISMGFALYNIRCEIIYMRDDSE